MQRISPANQNFNDLDLIFNFFLNDTSTIFLYYLNGNFEEFLKMPFLFTNIIRFFAAYLLKMRNLIYFKQELFFM